MIGLLAKAERFSPKLCFSLKLVVPELVSIVFGGVWRLKGGKRSTGVIGFAVAGSEEKESGQHAKLESFHRRPSVYWAGALRPLFGMVDENGIVGPALSHCWVLASSAAARLTALAATTFCALIMATTNCLSI